MIDLPGGIVAATNKGCYVLRGESGTGCGQLRLEPWLQQSLRRPERRRRLRFGEARTSVRAVPVNTLARSPTSPHWPRLVVML